MSRRPYPSPLTPTSPPPHPSPPLPLALVGFDPRRVGPRDRIFTSVSNVLVEYIIPRRGGQRGGEGRGEERRGAAVGSVVPGRAARVHRFRFGPNSAPPKASGLARSSGQSLPVSRGEPRSGHDVLRTSAGTRARLGDIVSFRRRSLQRELDARTAEIRLS